MKLYDLTLSGNAYKVRLFLNILGREHQIIPVDVMAGEHKKPDYLELNPKGQVPVLQDGDLTLSDSQAILVYLAEAYGPDWYPQAPALRGQIQYWLSTAANEIARGPADARLAVLFKAPIDLEQATAKSQTILDLLNRHLKGRDWLAGNTATIADLAVFPYVGLAGDAHIDLSDFPSINAWIKRIKALPGYVGMPGL